jgi:hypothetical protein
MAQNRVAKDYARLRELLVTQERFPLEYLHKFIGRNTPAFDAGVQAWKDRHRPISCPSDRLSASQGHRSITFVLQMDTVDELIAMLEATDAIPDLVMVL